MSTAGGRVSLVGAGPGDPDLVTLRGARRLAEADVVVYDSLASRALLALATRAECIDVGRRGHEEPARTQEQISALLVERARAGQRVVRLKGGDPFVFGRGGEEASACRAAGVRFEVVPGVSSAIGALAYAGIPVTDRRHAASFAVVTGHKDPTRVREGIRWADLARAVDTLVVLMGVLNLEEIVGRILAGGLPPETPAAVVVDGTLPTQRTVEAPLGEIAQRAREAGVRAPAAVVIGDVVRLRAELAWFDDRPLFGLHVLVTRAAAQADSWLRALEEAGATAEAIPMIRTEPIREGAALQAALASLEEVDWLVLTSANAVREFAGRLAERGRELRTLRARVACVGPATARAAEEAGFPVHLVPERTDARGVLAALREAGPLAGRRVLLPRAEQGRETLPEGLRADGARVDVVPVYRTVSAEVDAPALLRGDFDALTFASPSAVRPFADALAEAAREAARRALVVAIGPVTAEALRARGLPPDVVPPRAGAAALVEALAQALRCRGEGPRAPEEDRP